ncbi:MAG: trypsin-like peptidase domain-containing protein [Oligoflexia bacterium]|nr:trypsin-like peptidase domain-containing protein [Oligoflexia bacterium]
MKCLRFLNYSFNARMFMPFTACALIVASFGVQTQVQAMSLFRIDDRTQVKDQEISKKMGSIFYHSNAICTAFASGKNQVTTAAHCINGNDLHEYTFRPFFQKEGEAAEKTILRTRVNNKTDVAILRVEGVDQFFETAESDLATGGGEENEISLLEVDGKDGLLYQCKEGAIWDTPSRGIFYHTFDTVPGSSGAPVLQNGKVIGMHIGNVSYKKSLPTERRENPDSDSEVVYNLAVRSKDLKEANLQKMRINREDLVGGELNIDEGSR